MPIAKKDGDSIGANVTFDYKGPSGYYNVGVIVETKPDVIYMMRETYLPASSIWSSQSVGVSGVYNAPFLDHGDLISCVKVIYPSGASPQPGGDGSLFKDPDQEVYVHQSEAEFTALYATYS